MCFLVKYCGENRYGENHQKVLSKLLVKIIFAIFWEVGYLKIAENKFDCIVKKKLFILFYIILITVGIQDFH